MQMKNINNTYSDNELYCLLTEGGKNYDYAFRELYGRYSKKVFFYCRKILNENSLADDAFQETFIKLTESAKRKIQVNSFGSYLFRIARNQCLNLKKKEHKNITFDEFQFPDTENHQENSEVKEILSSALELLSEEQKEAFVFQYYCGMSYNEISDIMGAPVTTVRNWLVRSKAKLRIALLPYFENEIK